MFGEGKIRATWWLKAFEYGWIDAIVFMFAILASLQEDN